MKRNKGVVSDYLPWIIIAVAVLVVLLIAAFFLRGQGVNLIDKIKGLFTGR
jgi:hypothetical protein